MAFEDHPVWPIAGGLAVTATLAVLAATVAGPYAAACLLGASVAGGAAVGLGVAGLCRGRRPCLDKPNAGPLAAAAAHEPPGLPHQPDGPEIPFADRLREQRTGLTAHGRSRR